MRESAEQKGGYALATARELLKKYFLGHVGVWHLNDIAAGTKIPVQALRTMLDKMTEDKILSFYDFGINPGYQLQASEEALESYFSK